MRRFYENLLGKRPGLDAPLPGGEALAEAKVWLRGLDAVQAEQAMAAGLTPRGVGEIRRAPARNPLPPFEHPFYWAAFVLVGDPDSSRPTARSFADSLLRVCVSRYRRRTRSPSLREGFGEGDGLSRLESFQCPRTHATHGHGSSSTHPSGRRINWPHCLDVCPEGNGSARISSTA
jgi:hypothetical protein